MWNPFRRLKETDAARLRALEIWRDEVDEDLVRIGDRTKRIDARLRQRAARGADDDGASAAAVVPPPPVAPEGDRTATREALRALLRERKG